MVSKKSRFRQENALRGERGDDDGRHGYRSLEDGGCAEFWKGEGGGAATFSKNNPAGLSCQGKRRTRMRHKAEEVVARGGIS